jgi:aromatic-L-amino-acid decarboxylase
MKTESLDIKNLDLYLEKTLSIVKDYIQGISNDPVYANIERDSLNDLFEYKLPIQGTDMDSLFTDIERNVIPYCTKIGHPRFLSWIVTSPSPAGTIGEIINLVLSQAPFLYKAGPVATILEDIIITWFNEMFGYSKDGGGVLVSGGTMGTLTALTIARQAFVEDAMEEGIQNLEKPLVVYTSDIAHVSVDKAVGVIGIGSQNLRKIPTDSNYRIRIDLLSQQVEKDIKDGLKPFCVVGQVGTSITGAVDSLDQLADFCYDNELWFHVDAAFGGGAILTEQGKALMNGIERADSISTDPHKWFFIPVEAGCVLVKDRKHIYNTFKTTPELFDPEKRYDYINYGIQSTRMSRAFKIWFAFRYYGLEKLSRIIEQNLELTKYFKEKLDNNPNFEVSSPIMLSAVCFQYIPKKKLDIKEHNKLQLQLLELIEQSGVAFLAPANIGEKIVLRANFSNHRTTFEDIVILMDLMDKLVEQL